MWVVVGEFWAAGVPVGGEGDGGVVSGWVEGEEVVEVEGNVESEMANGL